MPARELVMSGLGNLDRSVVLAPVPPFPFEKKRSAEEREILEMAQRKVTVRRLGWAAGGLAFSRLRTVYAFLAAGVLLDAEAKAAPQPVVHMETGTFLLSALQRQPDPTGQEAIRLEIQDELERSAHLDREAWLKVASTAPRQELLRALEEKMERYHALREAIGEDEQLKTDIEVILGRASAMLRLARQSPTPTPGAAPSESDAASGTRSTPRAAPPPVAAAGAPPAEASAPPAEEEEEEIVVEEDEEEALPDVEVEEEEEEVAAAPPDEEPAVAEEPAFAAEDPAIAAEEPTPYPEPVDAPSYAAAEESLSPPAPTTADMEAAVGPGSSNFAGRAKLEHLLMEGEVRMTVSDYANAVKVYQKLVEAAPKVPAFRLRLAVAMTCYPRTAKQAEREFLEAVRLAPNNADAHYQFGLYFKAMKVRSRAVAEMRTAVRINPRHEAAREELEALSPKDSVLGSLRKMFR
jgi:tetratricopeptide (TPR) repeat protein